MKVLIGWFKSIDVGQIWLSILKVMTPAVLPSSLPPELAEDAASPATPVMKDSAGPFRFTRSDSSRVPFSS